MDAENVDNLIANLDQLGLLPWDKTQVCILNFCCMRHIIYLYLLCNPRLTEFLEFPFIRKCLDILMV